MTAITYLVDVGGLQFDETQGVASNWIHALPIGKYNHPVYGSIDITSDRVKRFVENVKSRVRGVDPSINYVHNNNDEAAGWVKDADARSDGVWLFVEWVKDAAQAIKDKKWRYFSAEYRDEWEDNLKNKHKDVLFGGALTNRPFMKNLVPINLSEATVDTAFELVSLINGTTVENLKGGSGMELSEEQLQKIVDGLATKLSENKPKDTPETPAVPGLLDIPELKELAEQNPMVKLLIDQVEQQKKNNEQSQVQLKEAEIARRLTDFDHSKIILTPVARELTKKIAFALSGDLSDDFWKLLSEMKRGSSFLVELGERAGATVNYGTPKSAEKQFNELAAKLKSEHKLSEADAFERAAAQDPALYNRYRRELSEVNS